MKSSLLTRLVGQQFSAMVCTIVMAISAVAITATPGNGQNLVQPPASQSPHWSHINISDFGRALPYTADTATRNAAYDWFASHIDLVEAAGNVADYRSRNPNMKLFVYQLDLYTFQSPDAANLPESYFLHFSEDTQLKFYAMDRTEIATVTIPGCPAPSPMTLSCRVQVYNWTDRGWVFNLGDPAFQAWKAQQTLTNVGRTPQGVFLDAHGPGFTLSHSWGVQTVPISGGAIRELGAQRPGPDLDRSYNAAMVVWLDYLYRQFQQAGKFVLVNTSGYMLDQAATDQFMAARGLDTEFMDRPDTWAGAYQYKQFVDVLNNLTAQGGVVDLHGTWCYQGPSGYTAGNYASPVGRYRMWRLASYYQAKEPVGSPGVIYFNTAFCSNSTVQVQDNPTEWLPAYQVNIGQPAGNTVAYQQGTAGIASSDGRQCPYTIFTRPYTNAMVLVRSRDFWDCVDFGDGAAVTVTLPSPGQLLLEDGSLGPRVTSLRLRNAEAAIVYGITSNAVSPPPLTSPTTTQSVTTTTVTSSPTPSTPAISSSPTPPNPSPANRQPDDSPVSGLLSKLKSLMQRVK